MNGNNFTDGKLDEEFSDFFIKKKLCFVLCLGF